MKNRITCISLVVALTVSVGLIGCTGEYLPEITEYSLTVSSTEGGDVTAPGEGVFTYHEGEVVSLMAVAESGYGFASWAGDVSSIADPHAAATTITMNDDYSVTANFYEIPTTYRFEEGGLTFPDPDLGAAVRGEIREEGYMFPSDLQRHSFFTGIT